jgi:hypothetical protein
VNPALAADAARERSAAGFQILRHVTSGASSWPLGMLTYLTLQTNEGQRLLIHGITHEQAKVAVPTSPGDDWLLLTQLLVAEGGERVPTTCSEWTGGVVRVLRMEQPQHPNPTWSPPESPSTFGELLTTCAFDVVRNPHAGRALDSILGFLKENQPDIYQTLLNSPAEGRTEELACILEFLGAFTLPEGVNLDEILASRWELDNAGGLMDA